MMGLPQPRRDITARISLEYPEMPGLLLTLPRRRASSTPIPIPSKAALTRRIDSSVLRRVGAFYVRVDRGRRCA